MQTDTESLNVCEKASTGSARILAQSQGFAGAIPDENVVLDH